MSRSEPSAATPSAEGFRERVLHLLAEPGVRVRGTRALVGAGVLLLLLGTLLAWWRANDLPARQARNIGGLQLKMLRQVRERLRYEPRYRLQILESNVEDFVASGRSPDDFLTLSAATANLTLEEFRCRIYDADAVPVLDWPPSGLRLAEQSPEELDVLLRWSRDRDNYDSALVELARASDSARNAREIVRYTIPRWKRIDGTGPLRFHGFACLWLDASRLFAEYLQPTYLLPGSTTFVLRARTPGTNPQLVWHSNGAPIDHFWTPEEQQQFLDTLTQDTDLLRLGGEGYDLVDLPRGNGTRRREIVSAIPFVFGSQRWILCHGTPYEVATEVTTGLGWWTGLVATFLVLGGGLTLLLWPATGEQPPASVDRFPGPGSARQRDYRAVFAENPIGMMVFDPGAKLLDCNYAAERLVGLPKQEAVGASLLNLFESRSIGRFWQRFREAGHLHERDVELLRRRDAVSTRVELWGRQIGDHWILMAQDVEQRRELERQIARLERMDSMGALASTLAHDFNNLLGQIQILVSNLQVELDGESHLTRNLALIEEKVDDASELVRNLLSAREQIVARRPVPVPTLLQEFAQELRATAPAGVAVHLDVAEDVGPVWLTPHAVRRMLNNLAVNAFDAMPRGGELRLLAYGHEVTSEQASELALGRYAVLEIADTGTGVDEAVLDRIFEPFVTTKRSGKGTGLGLWTVHNFCRRAGGGVKVWSRLGVGTRFSLYLPNDPPHGSRDDQDEDDDEEAWEPASSPQQSRVTQTDGT